MYGDDDSKIRDRYAPIWGGMGRIINNFNKNFRGEVAAGMCSGSGKFNIGNTKASGSLTLTSVEGIVRHQDKEWAWGGGLVFLNCRERVSISDYSGSDSGSGIGLVLGGAYDINVGKSKLSLKLEYLTMFTGPELSGARLSIGFKDVLEK